MKKALSLMLTFLFAFSLNASVKKDVISLSDDNDELKIGSFSYADECAKYTESNPCVVIDGFENTTEQKIESAQDAINLARNEINSSYSLDSVYFDEVEKIWKVYFVTKSDNENFVVAGGDVSVYLTENGMTVLMILGE